MHACHADASCHLGVTRTLKMLKHFYWWVGTEACTRWWVRRAASSIRHEKPLAKRFAGLHSPSPCPTAPKNPSVLTTLGPCRSQPLWVPTDRSSKRFLHPLHEPLQPTGGHVRCHLRGIYSRRNRQHFGETLNYPLRMLIHYLIRQRTPKSAPSWRQPLTDFSVYTNSQQAPTSRVVTAASNVSTTTWQKC